MIGLHLDFRSCWFHIQTILISDCNISTNIGLYEQEYRTLLTTDGLGKERKNTNNMIIPLGNWGSFRTVQNLNSKLTNYEDKSVAIYGI